MIWNYENGRIFSTDESGKLLAEANYVHTGNGTVDIEHVYVTPELRGSGAANETMKIVCDYLRKEGLKATASCSYANSWFKKNRENYSDIISEDIDDQAAACRIDGKH